MSELRDALVFLFFAIIAITWVGEIVWVVGLKVTGNEDWPKRFARKLLQPLNARLLRLAHWYIRRYGPKLIITISKGDIDPGAIRREVFRILEKTLD